MEQLTGDELAAKVRSDMGYLIAPSYAELKLGEIIKIKATLKMPLRTPLMVVGIATKQDCLNQRAYVKSIAPYIDVSLDSDTKYFYFVEAAD